MNTHAMTLLFFFTTFLLVSVSSSQPSSVPLHDIIGKNISTSNVYYIRNYTIGSYSGAGPALYASDDYGSCPLFVGFAPTSSNTGLAIKISLPPTSNATVIYPGDRFKISFVDSAPCRRSAEWAVLSTRGLFGAYIVTRGWDSKENYFSVAVDGFGRYTLQSCGPCANCRNLCTVVQLSRDRRFRSPGDSFNFFFQKKVSATDGLLQSH